MRKKKRKINCGYYTKDENIIAIKFFVVYLSLVVYLYYI